MARALLVTFFDAWPQSEGEKKREREKRIKKAREAGAEGD